VVDGAAVLPLDPSATIAVVGPLADRVNLGDGGSSDVWDLECATALDGMTGAFIAVHHDDGGDLARAARVAADADAALVVVGYTYLDEGEYIGATGDDLTGLFPAADEPEVAERFAARLADLPITIRPDWHSERTRGFSVGGDRRSLRLHDSDVALIRAVAAANPRTVVVIQAGSAVVVDDWVDAVPAVAQAWYGGCQAGPGLADVLTGAVDPSGRLPFSVPHDEAHLPAFDADATSFRYDRWHGWWHLAREGTEAAFAFGFGLSYTTFELTDSDVHIDGGTIEVRATVANTGDRDGIDVVQVYAELPDPDAPPRLVGFARVAITAGTTGTVAIAVPLEALATRDPAQRGWRAPAGAHRIVVSRFAGDPTSRSHELLLERPG
jgi:beta-glucosidase